MGSSFDQLTISGGNVTVVYNGTLALTFLNGYAPTSGTFQLASPDALASGNFTSITSNLANDTFTFNPASGILSVTAVPEPAAMAQIGLSCWRWLLVPVHAGGFGVAWAVPVEKPSHQCHPGKPADIRY